MNNGVWGSKQDFEYSIPSYAVDITFRGETTANGMNIGSGSGQATLTWDKVLNKARVHAWVNGCWSCKNKVEWTVMATYLC